MLSCVHGVLQSGMETDGIMLIVIRWGQLLHTTRFQLSVFLRYVISQSL